MCELASISAQYRLDLEPCRAARHAIGHNLAPPARTRTICAALLLFTNIGHLVADQGPFRRLHAFDPTAALCVDLTYLLTYLLGAGGLFTGQNPPTLGIPVGERTPRLLDQLL